MFNFVVEEPWTCCRCEGISTPAKVRRARSADLGKFDLKTKFEAEKEVKKLNAARKCYCEKRD